MEEDLKEELLNNPTEVARVVLNSPQRDNMVRKLWELLKSAEDKKLKKSCKKVFYILKSNGVEVDSIKPERNRSSEKQAESSESFAKDSSNVEPYRAFIYIPDSLGNSRMLISLYNENQANYELFDIIYSMEEGIRQFGEQKVSKNTIKKISDHEAALVEVPAKYALSRLKDVTNSTNTQSKVSENIRSFIESAGNELHPVLLIYPPSISSIVSTEEEKELFSRPEIARLVVPEKHIKEYRQEILQAQNSILIINNMTPQERVAKIIDRFVLHYFTPKRLAMYRILLLDIALYLHSIGEPILAKRLVSYAEELIRPVGNIGTHPLIRLMVYKSFFID